MVPQNAYSFIPFQAIMPSFYTFFPWKNTSCEGKWINPECLGHCICWGQNFHQARSVIGETNVKIWKSVRVVANGNQETGVYTAPEGCEFEDKICDHELNKFSIWGISVENFPANGIQTRWVKEFRIQQCSSLNNLRNGIYPTISKNGIVSCCTASGSLDSGIWIAGTENSTVNNNEIHSSVTGFEVALAKNLIATENYVHDNVIGFGLYHPNMAGTPLREDVGNWFEKNMIMNNSMPNSAPPNSFQAGLLPGIGIYLQWVFRMPLFGTISLKATAFLEFRCLHFALLFNLLSIQVVQNSHP